MQAGLVNRPLTWRDIFTAPGRSLGLLVVVLRVPVLVPTGFEATELLSPNQRTAA